jgi:beta-galactosidase
MRETNHIFRWLAVAMFGVLGAPAGIQAADHVWIEAEAVTQANVEAKGSGWNNPKLISGGQVLQFNIDPKDIDKAVPAEGIVLSYEFDAPSAGSYESWQRVGFEGVRAQFDWRVNGGAWVANSHKTHPSIDVVESAFWNPIGWTPLGAAELKAGKNTLEIRLQKVVEKNGDKDEVQRILYVADAICFHKGPWTPNHHHPPGEGWKAEADKKAAEQVFKVAAAAEGVRAVTDLAGVWQYAAWDERGEITEETRSKGVDQLPDLKTLNWYGISIPGDRNDRLPQFLHNHRYLLRTRVDVPAELKGRSFFLDLREISLIATLFVNGKKAGDFDAVYGFWKPDITALIEPGKTNEIVLVFKDAFYALRPGNDGTTLRNQYYLPFSFFQRNQGVTFRFDQPVHGAEETGILEGVKLVAAGPARVQDVFVRTQVQAKQLEADVTVANSGSAPAQVEVSAVVQPWPSGAAVATIPAQSATVAPGKSAKVAFQHALGALNLWWPDDPQLYQLVTTVKSGGKVIDTQSTRFGVREWQIRENQFYLNGIRWQLRADLSGYGGPKGPRGDAKVARDFWTQAGITMFRLRFQYNWGGMRYSQTLGWMDEVGMPVRLAVSSFDGQVAAYGLRDNPKLYENWRKQMRNRAVEWRNHPSVFIWELDNEVIYINARNLGNLDSAEPEFKKGAAELAEIDPTRATVSGGGNALRDQSLPTYGVHYFEVDDREYPQEAYTIEKSLAVQNKGGNWNPWPMDFAKKPTFMSETAFLPGRNAAGFAAVGGEATFLGKSEAKPAAGIIGRWLTEGYRWKGVAAFHHWFDDNFTGNTHFSSFQPVAVFCREWNWTFGAGQTVPRTLKVFNETRFNDPVEAAWQFKIGDKVVAEGKKSFSVPAGGGEEWPVTFQVPVVKERTAARFTLTASQKGKEVFREDKPSVIIDPAAGPKPALSGDLLVLDPKGSVAQRLKARSIPFKEVKSLAEVPEKFGALVVGADAVPAADATNSRWKALAAAGNKILVLEQNEPLHFQAVPANFEIAPFGGGRIAFIQELDHPIFNGLADPDFFTWSGDGVVYKKPYKKATTGARSLAHADNNLAYSVIATSAVNEGLFVFSQAVVGEKLKSDPVAQRLFDNMLAYVADYKLVQKASAVVADGSTPTGKMLAGLGMNYEAAADPVKALQGKAEVVAVQAVGDNLKKLAAAPDVVKAFTDRGGWLVILGITPETLADFNQIAGTDHILRPFRQEKVQFPPVRDPLTAGLGLQDVVMTSGRRIQDWNQDEWPVDDGFKYIVDLDDIAPFSTFPGPEYWNDPGTKGPGDDTWPLNMVNGYLSDTHWRLIFSIHLMRGDPAKWDIEFPREEEVTTFSIAPNSTYHEITRIRLTFDGKADSAQEFDLSGSDRQDLAVTPVKAKKMNMEILKWNPKGSVDVIGVDNLWIRVKRPEGFSDRVKPLLNIGGLVKYPRGKGGILLNQYNIIDNEQNPANAQKKQIVTATLLRNLGASFAGGKTIVAGQGLNYAPVNLDNFCNLYLRSDRGFPVGNNDLSGLPVGRQKFAGVDYQIRDFATSPLESGIILHRDNYKVENRKDEVKGIAVGRKAEALFFLHTLLPGDNWQPRNDQDQEPIVFKYVVRYEDGSTAELPVQLGLAIAPWLQDKPRALRDAALAWQTAGKDGKQIVVYQLQWTNPRPDKSVKEIDIVYGPEKAKWGAPVILGISTAESQK